MLIKASEVEGYGRKAGRIDIKDKGTFGIVNTAEPSPDVPSFQFYLSYRSHSKICIFSLTPLPPFI